MMMMNKIEFSNYIRHSYGPKTMEIKNSYGVHDYMKFYRKTRPRSKEYVLTPQQYYKIVRTIGLKISEVLATGQPIDFPERMGRVTVRRYEAKLEFKNGKLVTSLPIDWKRTLMLWYEDSESKKKKTLIRCEDTDMYRFIYIKMLAAYNNKNYYEFKFNRFLKKKLIKNIKNKDVHALMSRDNKITDFYGR